MALYNVWLIYGLPVAESLVGALEPEVSQTSPSIGARAADWDIFPSVFFIINLIRKTINGISCEKKDSIDE